MTRRVSQHETRRFVAHLVDETNFVYLLFSDYHPSKPTLSYLFFHIILWLFQWNDVYLQKISNISIEMTNLELFREKADNYIVCFGKHRQG